MRNWLTWSIFVAGLAVAGGVMAWVSSALVELEHVQAEAAEHQLAEENVNLALWQMDSELSPVVADEATRPYFQYLSFYPAEGAYTRMFNEIEKGDVLIPSQLLTNTTPQIVVHFQFEPDGSLTSPQVPTGNKRDLAESRYVTHEEVERAIANLETVRKLTTREQMLAILPERKIDRRDPLLPDMVYADDDWAAQNDNNKEDYGKRAETHKKTTQKRMNEQTNSYQQEALIDPVQIAEGQMTAVWVSGSLILARRLSLDGREYVQGCLLDWDRVKADLQFASADLLPNASFQATSGDGSYVEAEEVYRLAALPVDVLPGHVPVPRPEGRSALRLTMYVSWVSLALVAFGLAFVLQRTLGLAQRRAEFVSAVSHELRTPLTTFRMYTEMLASGRVKDETARAEYLNTLHSESLRLGHLVENVLAYARLENSKVAGRIEAIALTRLMQRATERLSLRTQQAGMELVTGHIEGEANVMADPGAVEQIVFNLVDNACKYATSAEDKRIHLETRVSEAWVEISVSDHGPGITRREAAKLFKPFRKSAQAAANSAPGVGLGLSLCRRLARAMKGDLTLQGASTFVLKLPRA